MGLLLPKQKSLLLIGSEGILISRLARFFVITFLLPFNFASGMVNIVVDPPTQSVVVGKNVVINVNFSSVQDLKGVDLKLSYNPTVLRCISIQKEAGIAEFTTLLDTINQQNGEVEFVAVYLAQGAGITNASGTFCKLTFTAISSGISEMILQNVGAVIGNSSGETIPYQLISGTVSVNTAVVEPTEVNPPVTYALRQNYPNPFFVQRGSPIARNTLTQICYQLPEPSDVTLVVYNILGQRIKQLLQSHQPAGYYRVFWDGRDEKGEKVSSGVYLYVLKAGNFSQTKKMLILP